MQIDCLVSIWSELFLHLLILTKQAGISLFFIISFFEKKKHWVFWLLTMKLPLFAGPGYPYGNKLSQVLAF